MEDNSASVPEEQKKQNKNKKNPLGYSFPLGIFFHPLPFAKWRW